MTTLHLDHTSARLPPGTTNWRWSLSGSAKRYLQSTGRLFVNDIDAPTFSTTLESRYPAIAKPKFVGRVCSWRTHCRSAVLRWICWRFTSLHTVVNDGQKTGIWLIVSMVRVFRAKGFRAQILGSQIKYRNSTLTVFENGPILSVQPKIICERTLQCDWLFGFVVWQKATVLRVAKGK